MRPLVVALGAVLAVSVVLVPVAWGDARAPSGNEILLPEQHVETTLRIAEQPAAGLRVEIPTEQTPATNNPAAPSAQQYVKFAELHPSVQNFLRHTGEAHYKMNESDLEALEYDSNLVASYTAQVERLAAELKTAKEIYNQEIERVTDAAVRSGTFTEFSDETAFMKAVEAAEDSAENPFVIPLQGEDEGPSGEPRPYFKLVSLKLDDHPALREAKSYLDNHEQWREVLRAKALGLIASAQRSRQ